MQESQFHSFNDYEGSPVPELASLKEAFLDPAADHISRAEVRAMAAQAATALEPVLATGRTTGEKSTLLLYVLNQNDLATLAMDRTRGTDDESGLPDSQQELAAELEPQLAPLRRAFLEELARQLPDVPIYGPLLPPPSGNHDVLETHAHDAVLKRPKDWLLWGRAESSRVKAGRLEALRELYALPERSPFISYSVLQHDPSTEPGGGTQIQARLAITPLAEVVKRADRPGFDDILGYVADTMHGAQFLLNHGLSLSDLSSHNLAINHRTERGLLFDLGNLHLAGQDVEEYGPVHAGYLPPERESGDNTSPITEAEMVYEYGVALGRLAAAYGEPAKRSLVALTTAMTTATPEDRPRLAAVIRSLDERENSV